MSRSAKLGRLSYLDGLRGIAAVGVFFGHLMIALFPTVVTQNPSDAHSAYDAIIGISPLGVLWNGNFGVCIFFVLSGYVLSDFCSKGSLSFEANVLRRYLRLALPILLVSVFAWALLRIGAYHNSDASEITRSGWLGGWYNFPPSLIAMAKEALYGTFASGSNAYNPNLWTMRTELAGSLYVFCLFALFATKSARLLALAVFACIQFSDYLLLFAVGAFFYQWQEELVGWFRSRIPSSEGVERTAIGLMIIALLLGGLPAMSNSPGANWLERHGAPLVIRILNGDVLAPMLRHAEAVHEFAACLLFLSLLLSTRIKAFFSSPIPVFFGRISFTLYLIHIPLICSVMTWVVLYFPYTTPYGVRAAWAAGLTIALTIGLSAVVNDFVDVRMTAISRNAGRWLNDLGKRTSGNGKREVAAAGPATIKEST